MPSLRSNKNKWSLPVYPPPAETICIPVTVPDNPEWIGLFLGALYRLAQQIYYDRDENKTARLVAARWQDIYLDTVKRVWGCEGGMFDLRLSPADECSVEKTVDGGETWVEVFRLDSTCALTNIIRNPYTGDYGYEIEGVGFYRFPEGPWGESLYPDFDTVGPPIVGADKKCVAATTAAYVLRNLYVDVGQKLLEVVAGTDWDYVGALGSILQGFLLIIGAAAVQPYVAFATLLGIVGVRQQYVDYPLTAADEERLKCLLLANSLLLPNGSVTFDFDGLYAAIDLDSPKNGLVRFLLTMIGPDALNYAGAIEAGVVADCNECGTVWCRNFDFTADDWGFTPLDIGGVPSAVYLAGVGWQHAPIVETSTNGYSRMVWLAKAMTSTRITEWHATFDYVQGTFEFNLDRARLNVNGTPVYNRTAVLVTQEHTLHWVGNVQVSSGIDFFIRSSLRDDMNVNGSVILKSLQLRGDGVPPEGGVDCL